MIVLEATARSIVASSNRSSTYLSVPGAEIDTSAEFMVTDTEPPMRRIAVIIGAGPGLGASLAQALSHTHSLLLLSRSLPASLPRLNLKIPDDKLLAASSDGSRKSLDEAIMKVKDRWPEGRIDVACFNNGGNFGYGDFLTQKVEDLQERFTGGPIAAFNFAQVVLPLMLSNTPSSKTGTKGTLIFTGATMAMRGSAKFSAMAPPMFARRALSQSLAREFGPQGVHVAHVIVDGHIDPANEGKTLRPDDIAQTYLSIIAQPKSTFTQELDLRPCCESF